LIDVVKIFSILYQISFDELYSNLFHSEFFCFNKQISSKIKRFYSTSNKINNENSISLSNRKEEMNIQLQFDFKDLIINPQFDLDKLSHLEQSDFFVNQFGKQQMTILEMDSNSECK
jgi:hypothetical protein